MKYEELEEEVDDVEEEWKKYKDEFDGNAEELCGRSTGMGGKAIKIRNGGQPKSHQQYVKRWKPGRLLKRPRSTEISLREGCCIYYIWTEEKCSQEALDKARNDMEADVYPKLDEDTGTKMIYKMARHRDEYSKDVIIK